MAAYLFAELEVTDPADYAEYRQRVPSLIAACGGRYLARGGATELLDGEGPPQRLVLVEFPDMARLRAFYHSAEYQPMVAIRRRATRSRLLAIDGI